MAYIPTHNRIRPALCGAAGAICATLLCAAPAPAADGGSAPVFAASGYWTRFVDFWLGGLREQNGIVLLIIGVGALSLFIITRGKWIK